MKVKTFILWLLVTIINFIILYSLDATNQFNIFSYWTGFIIAMLYCAIMYFDEH